MPVAQSKIIANKKYRAKTYDTIGFDVKKGKRDEYKKIAAKLGLSLAAFLTDAADEFARNHAGTDFVERVVAPNEQPEKLSADERKLIEEFSRLSSDAQKSLMKFLQAVNETKGGV